MRKIHHNLSQLVVVSLGGSIMCPRSIDVRYLRAFRKQVLAWIEEGHRFIIVAGGGRVSRQYQQAAAKLVELTDDDKDWIGIHATRLNAHLLRTLFRDVADPVVLDKRHRLRRLRKPITIASGWQPGWSTDYVSTVLAYDFGAREVVIAGKPAYVYERDPKDDPDAERFASLSWSQYRTLVPQKWSPGSHSPVDPVAAAFAQKHGITAIVINGKRLRNFDDLLSGRPFHGTLISNKPMA